MFTFLPLKVSFVARQHLVLLDVLFGAHPTPFPESNGVNLAANSLSSRVDPDAYVAVLYASLPLTAPLCCLSLLSLRSDIWRLCVCACAAARLRACMRFPMSVGLCVLSVQLVSLSAITLAFPDPVSWYVLCTTLQISMFKREREKKIVLSGKGSCASEGRQRGGEEGRGRVSMLLDARETDAGLRAAAAALYLHGFPRSSLQTGDSTLHPPAPTPPLFLTRGGKICHHVH